MNVKELKEALDAYPDDYLVGVDIIGEGVVKSFDTIYTMDGYKFILLKMRNSNLWFNPNYVRMKDIKENN